MDASPIREIDAKEFCAFGQPSQDLAFTSWVAAAWTLDCQGKTGLAEDVEFLFAGRIVRREVMVGGQDEFADAPRNRRLPASEVVYAAAGVVRPDVSRTWPDLSNERILGHTPARPSWLRPVICFNSVLAKVRNKTHC